VFVLVGAASAPGYADPRVGLRAASGASSYRSGETVTIHLTLTNTGQGACRAVAQPEIAVTVVSMKRDGKRVWPKTAPVAYEDGVASMATAALRQVPAGGHVELSLTSRSQSLQTLSWTPGRSALLSSWSVKEPGTYTLALVAGAPPAAGLPDDVCAGLSGKATARFAVKSAGLSRTFVIAAAGLGAVLLLLVLLLVVGVRRRRRRPYRMVSWCLLILLAVAAAPGLVPPRATADIKPLPGSGTAFSDTLNGCLADFKRYPELYKEIQGLEKIPVVVTPLQGTGSSTTSSTNPVKGSNKIDIYWGWKNKAPYVGDGVARDPCSALYHELAHAADYADGGWDLSACDDKQLSKAEARALYNENRYRAKHAGDRKTVPRTRFGPVNFDNVPKNLDDCNKPNTTGWKPPTDLPGSEDCGPECGQTQGDPHLRTFDGKYYDAQGVGEYTAVASRVDTLRIQVRQQPFPDSDAVSVNTAVAMNVVGSRVGVYLTDGRLRLLVGGRLFGPGTFPLAGGGSVARWSTTGQTVVVASWPDGTRARVRAMGPWGLSLDVSLGQSRRGTVTGLLGNADGTPDNDPTASEALRIRQQDSLFDYAPGQSTATFTDPRFPRAKPNIPNRAAAEEICRSLGITAPQVLEACVLDVALTGQASFGDSAATAQRVTGQAPSGSGSVSPGGVLHDGDRASATLTSGAKHTYPMKLGAATVVRLVEVTGADLHIDLVGPPGTDSPGFTFTSNFIYRLQPNADYRLEVSGAAGPYGFRVATTKERRRDAGIGDRVTGSLDAPGRTDLYVLRPAAPAKVYLAEGTPCAGISVALVDDGPQPRAYSPSRPCWEITIGDLQPGRRYLITVWSDEAKTGEYAFRIAQRT
jgi:hypothetical protein